MKFITKKIRGIKFSFINLKEFATIYKDIFLRGDYKFESKEKSPFILDGGSHIGISVLYFKKLYPEAKIIAFEPNPNTFKLLKLNIEQNCLQNVKLINTALASKQGKMEFYISREIKFPWTLGDAGVKNTWYSPKNCKTIKVPAVKLSSYINQSIDLLKLDVEGMEEIVLKESEDKLHLIKEIIVEFHGNSTNKENRIESILDILDRNSFQYQIKKLGRFRLTPIAPEKIKNIEQEPFILMIYAKK